MEENKDLQTTKLTKRTKSTTNVTSKNSTVKNKIISITKFDRLEDPPRIDYSDIILMFIICAILGWFIEIGYVYLVTGKIVNRGMSYGPYCSIYGYGSLILYFLFRNVKPVLKNIPYVFITSAIFMGAFELLSGTILNLLGMEMWNYDGQFGVIFHYCTVPIMIGWGILGTLYVFFVRDFLLFIINLVPERFAQKLAIIILCLYLLDNSLSFFNIYSNPEKLYKLVHP